MKKISSTETTVFVYDGGGELVAEYSTALASTPQVSYLTQDHLGSPRVITNENGVVTSRKDFMAYGEEAASANRVSGSGGNGYDPAGTRKDYTGYEKDSETGLEYAQARYYNPVHGRYTSIDPMTASATIKNPQTFNRYSYVLNSPYKFADPLGLISQSTGAAGQWSNSGEQSLIGGGGGALTAGGTETMFAEEFAAIVKSENDRDAAIAATLNETLHFLSGSITTGSETVNYNNVSIVLTAEMSSELAKAEEQFEAYGRRQAASFLAAVNVLNGRAENLLSRPFVESGSAPVEAMAAELANTALSAKLGVPIQEINSGGGGASALGFGGSVSLGRTASTAVNRYNDSLSEAVEKQQDGAGQFAHKYDTNSKSSAGLVKFSGTTSARGSQTGGTFETRQVRLYNDTLKMIYNNRMTAAIERGRNEVMK